MNKNRDKIIKEFAGVITVFSLLLFSQKAYASDYNKTLKDLLGNTNMANADLHTVQQTIINITNYVVKLGGVIAFIMILYSSFMYATSFGEESKAETAKKSLIWSIVGTIIVTCFALIMRLVNQSLNMGLN